MAANFLAFAEPATELWSQTPASQALPTRPSLELSDLPQALRGLFGDTSEPASSSASSSSVLVAGCALAAVATMSFAGAQLRRSRRAASRMSGLRLPPPRLGVSALRAEQTAKTVTDAQKKRPGGVPTKGMSEGMQAELMQRQALVREANAKATPVPTSFEQTVGWACAAAVNAAEGGKLRQTMYFSAGGEEMTGNLSGNFGEVFIFAEELVMSLAASDAMDGARIKVVFSDIGAQGMASSRWDLSEAENIELSYLPQINQQTPANPAQQYQLDELCDCDFMILVAPIESDLPAVLLLVDEVNKTGREIPFVMLNPRLLSKEYNINRNTIRSFKRMINNMTETFHLEQIDSPDEDMTLNPAVIARVYPRPFSVWEDCPEDPDAVDGYFLLDINDELPPRFEELRELLTFSQEARRALIGS
eukprot:TRINITY_DN2696_c0_g1_i1.p1 TRINITY_DN2696_c0_g1~~TRINITY_DN2696_c0_g1_i1.p1  ORF type:complete len:420 (-),score=94.45 TRINITY_DN2696_c0_g1_i1:24-1283(-)